MAEGNTAVRTASKPYLGITVFGIFSLGVSSEQVYDGFG
jgi:hypothetical protein